MNKSIFIISLALLGFLFGCERKEKLYPKPVVPVGIQFKDFNLGDNYENQIWFDIETQNISVNSHEIWDIAFASDASNRILINGGKNGNYGVAVVKAHDLSFGKIDPTTLTYTFDNPSGEDDSLVFDNWYRIAGPGDYRGKDSVYIIDRGNDSFGTRRYVWMQMMGRTGGNYHFLWNFITDTSHVNAHDVTFFAPTDYNYAYYSFQTASLVNNEPLPNTDWDLVFTTYKQYIPDPSNGNKPYPYILRGVLSNPYLVKVYEVPAVNATTWDQLTLSYATTVPFSSKFDEIGYDWKIWNMSANKYTMANKIYIVRDTKGNYFKLRFVDFYDSNGKKGVPKMAWEILK